MTQSRRRMTVLAVVALGVVVLVVALVLALVRANESGPQSTPVYQHLEEFQALADEHGDRATGSSGYEAAAQYVEQQLEDFGYHTDRQYFTFEHRGTEVESFNIIAETDAGTDDDVIMLGAHLDGVRDSAAINDNASGAAALLVAAKDLSQQDDIENTVRFAWWGAEEFPRSHGSHHYVENLADDGSGGLDDIAAYMNFDMVASPNYVVGVYDARDFDSRLPIPEGSEEVMEVFTDYFDSREQPWVTTAWNFDSDQVAFARADVAVGGLFTGSDERKSARQAIQFGGTAGQPRDPHYHSSDDDISNVNQEALNIMTAAISHAASRLAEDTSALE